MISKHQAHKFCKDDISKIENYDKATADTTQTWDCHHRTEIWWNCTAKELIDNECYYKRKACELIFLTPSEHGRLHHAGSTLTDAVKQKISEAHKGKHLSEETRKKMSETRKGLFKGKGRDRFSDETRKKMSEAKKGKVLTAEHRRKIAESVKNRWAKKKETRS